MINVTKSVLPSLEEYVEYLKGIWERGQLTNHGPLVLELEKKLREYFGVKHLFFVNNGTIALQIAIKALQLKGEIITTPFSYVATTSTILWEGCRPVFADIEPTTLCIDPEKVEQAISKDTSAIMATHVYGNSCDVDAIARIAAKYNVKVIYDAAHAFGVKYKDKSLLNYGDISAISFHATKLFHTIEGGAVATNDDAVAHKISYMRNFGHNGPEDFFGVGINGKSSEFHAAMGLALLPGVAGFIERRSYTTRLYDELLAKTSVVRPKIRPGTQYNFAYYPVLFESESHLLSVRSALNNYKIFPRRYFYPALNTLKFLPSSSMPIAENAARRALCLPLYPDLQDADVRRISMIIGELCS